MGRPTPRRRPRLTGRMAILVLVLAVLTVSYASSLRAFLQQRSRIDDSQAAIADREATIRTLSDEKQRLHDPDYLTALVREQLGYVLPGETVYVVHDHGKPLDAEATLTDPRSVGSKPVPEGVVRASVGVLRDRGHAAPQAGPPGQQHPGLGRRLAVGPVSTGPDTRDLHTVRSQLGRAPRGIRAVGHRCPCGNPDVVVTEPRLADGSPFPTTYYLTCPRAASRIGTLEADGVMREMEQRLADDEGLAAAYAGAHQRYLAARAELGEVPEIAGISAGGMPNRVKCLHVLAAQALAQGPGVNPLGDEVLARLGDWWALVPAWSPRVVEVGAQRASRPVAAIDCGTNTIKLLIGTLPEIAVRETRTVRLGEDVDRTGRLGDGALARTYAAIDEYAVLVRDHGVPVERVRFCATSATRDADNAAEFADGVQQRLGVRPDVLSGTEEAALSFDGAVRNLRDEPALPVLVLDIGGGSTELIRGARLDAPPTAAHSMDIGSVRLFERHLRSDPPTREQVAACVRDIDAHLDACPVAVDRAATVVGVSGTSLTVAAGALGVAYAPETLDQAVVPVADVREVVDRLVSMTVAERLALPYVSAGRADVIAAGALILTSVLRRTPVDSLVVSVADILDGIAWSIQG